MSQQETIEVVDVTIEPETQVEETPETGEEKMTLSEILERDKNRETFTRAEYEAEEERAKKNMELFTKELFLHSRTKNNAKQREAELLTQIEEGDGENPEYQELLTAYQREKAEHEYAELERALERETLYGELRRQDEMMDALDREFDQKDALLNEMEQKLAKRDKALAIGGGVAGALSIGALLAFVRERKVHKQVVALIEEVAVALAEEQNEANLLSFEELFVELLRRLGETPVFSFRHPFAISRKELERTTDLFLGILKTAEELALRYVDFDTANTINVENVTSRSKGEV